MARLAGDFDFAFEFDFALRTAGVSPAILNLLLNLRPNSENKPSGES
jgi:hypothetical protein